ncbi:hypothetical protein AAVH_39237, partial [Aphelenchoides avenae]
MGSKLKTSEFELAPIAQPEKSPSTEDVRMRAQRERRARCHLDELRRRTFEVGGETQKLLPQAASDGGRKMSDSHLVMPK